ncbi:hypothetical protein J6590_066571 [Homalodisca vitripennis]|nr:hypothetical protein J6590_066571 [Homalodisca vitripennis]
MFILDSMTISYLKWPVLGSLLLSLVLLVMRTTHIMDSDLPASHTDPYDEDRSTDISDSRRSNWGSDSRDVDSSEILTVDRVFPLTRTLNQVFEYICRRFSLYMRLENKQILYLKNNSLNFNLTTGNSGNRFFATNPVISRMDSMRRLGNAFVSINTDTAIVLVQKLRFKILKFKYDYYDSDLNLFGHSSFILLKNTFLLNVTLSTNYDNSECKLDTVDLVFIPNERSSCILKCVGPIEAIGVYDTLKSKLYNTFLTEILKEIKSEIMPILVKVVNQSNICCYFNGKHKKSNAIFDFLSGSIFDG